MKKPRRCPAAQSTGLVGMRREDLGRTFVMGAESRCAEAVLRDHILHIGNGLTQMLKTARAASRVRAPAVIGPSSSAI